MKAAIPLAKNVLIPLGITAAASAIDSGNKKGKEIVRAGYGRDAIFNANLTSFNKFQNTKVLSE